MDNKEAYNNWALIYDSNENKTRDLDLLISQEVLSEYNVETIVEIGCGTGKNTEWLIEKAEKIYGLDFSNKMLEQLKRKINNPNLEVIEVDITKEWPLGGEIADLVTTNLVLEHIENLNHIFEQAARVLKEQGHFFVSELHSFKQYIGRKARFEQGNKTIELDCFVHHISDFVEAAKKAGFVCLDLQEWFDEGKETEVPRLVSFVFEKKGAN